MTCAACRAWCATSEKQLDIRVRNIGDSPDVRMHPCPNCGGTDWGTSREMIKEEPPRSRWPAVKPALWSAVLQLVAAAACIAYAIYLGPSWQGMANALCGGFNLAGGIYTTFLIRQRVLLDEGQELLIMMMAMNRELLSDKVHGVMANIHDDDDTPIAPDRLH